MLHVPLSGGFGRADGWFGRVVIDPVPQATTTTIFQGGCAALAVARKDGNDKGVIAPGVECDRKHAR